MTTRERVSVMFKRTELTPNPSITGVLDLYWRQRGEQLQNVKVSPKENPRLARMLLRFFSAMDDEKQLADLVKEQGDVLIESGLLVPKKNAPEPVDSEPTLDPSLLLFVPQRHRDAFRQARRERQRFFVDIENLFIQTGESRPEVPHPGLPPERAFPKAGKEGRLLWIFDPGTRMWSFYRLAKANRAAISALVKGKMDPSKLSPALFETLAHARVLVTEAGRSARAAMWSAVSASALRTKEVRWAVARDVLPPLQIAQLRSYSRHLYHEGYFYTDERHVRDNRREYLRDNPLVGFIHRQSGELMRHMTDDALFPSWHLLSRYQPGATLPEHTDRDQCAWNGSLALDTEVDGPMPKPWPLCVHSQGRKNKISLELGDLAIYQGTESPHSRPRLGPGRTETIMLWFYVPVAFQGDSLE